MYAHLTISRIRHDGINLAKLGRFKKEKKILDQSERNILDLFFCEFDPLRVFFARNLLRKDFLMLDSNLIKTLLRLMKTDVRGKKKLEKVTGETYCGGELVICVMSKS